MLTTSETALDEIPRVVSLLPAATEIVAALGAESTLVAITHECDFPPRVARAIPHVTATPIAVPEHTNIAEYAGVIDQQVREIAERGESLFHIHASDIKALHPTLFITQALCDVCAVDERDVRAIAATLTPSPPVLTLDGTTFNGVLADIQRVADAMDLHGDGEELIAGLTVRLRTIRRVLERARAPQPRVAVIEWTDPVYVAGHWVPELIEKAGAIDAISAPGSHSTIHTVESIRDAHPDVLVIAPCGYDVARAADEAIDVLARDEWRWARTLPVWAIDANALMTRPGPRIVDGVETMAALLHPTLFRPPSRAYARRINT